MSDYTKENKIQMFLIYNGSKKKKILQRRRDTAKNILKAFCAAFEHFIKKFREAGNV